MNTANSVAVLENIPLHDLFELYDAVAYEVEQISKMREDDGNKK